METFDRCQAVAKTTGNQCKLKPVKGTRYCKKHTKEIVGKNSPKAAQEVGKSKRSKSTKRSRGKVSEKMMDFELFAALPKMAQIEILLNLDRSELKKMCLMNKELANICRQQEFRRRYLERHSEGLFQGKIKLEYVFEDDKVGFRTYRIGMTDEKGNKIIVHILQLTGKNFSELSRVEYLYRIPNKKIYTRIQLFLRPGSTIEMDSIGLGKLSMKRTLEILRSIGRPDWKRDFASSEEFLNVIRTATKAILPWEHDVVLQGYKIGKIKIPDIKENPKAKSRSKKN